MPDSGEYDNSGIGSDLCLSYQTRVYGRCPKEAEVCRFLPSTDVRRRKRHGVLPKATNESLGPGAARDVLQCGEAGQKGFDDFPS